MLDLARGQLAGIHNIISILDGCLVSWSGKW